MAASALLRGGVRSSAAVAAAGHGRTHFARALCATPGKGEPQFQPETPQQRVYWQLSMAGVGVATAYFLYRVYTDYYTDQGRAAASGVVLDTPLYAGNPVVFMDVEVDGQEAGRMVFQLRKDVVPETAENFRRLFTGEAEGGRSYTGTAFHHVLPANYVVGGDVPGAGGKPEGAAGGFFSDENFGLLHAGAGVLSSASQIRDENGSRFFITLNRAPNLNGRYVAFGSLLAGADVLAAVGQHGDASGAPTARVRITNCGELRLPEELVDFAPSARA